MAILLLLMLLNPGETQQENRGASLHSAFEDFANRIPSFGTADFVYGFRDPSLEVAEFVRFLERGAHAAADFRPLLRDSNAKIRTLALIAIYNLEDPQLLPDIFSLANDNAETFPGTLPTSAPAVISGLARKQRQTVGEVATSILNIYMKAAGYFYGPFGRENFQEPGFGDYWKIHGGRLNSAASWQVRLSRASHETSPTPRNRIASIRSVRDGIDKLPEPERTFTLLWLHGELGSDALASEEELLRLSQKVGRVALLETLQRKIPSDDPALQPRPDNNWSYARMCIFILQHAAALLLPSDAPALLSQETWERDFQKNSIRDPLISPWWAIAAAQLDPGNSPAILESARTRFQGQFDGTYRLELAEALWRLRGEPQVATVVDWLYGELQRPPSPTWAISNTLDRLLKNNGRNNSLLARTLMDDPRFDDLNWMSLEVLARNMNTWSNKELISKEELDSAWSPSGIDLFMKDLPQALKDYPKENGALVDTLARWRRTLRQR